MNIHEWAAEQCGVDLVNGCIMLTDERGDYAVLWTMEDPRCREIVREYFQLETYVTFDIGDWVCEYDPLSKRIRGRGKTIAEAEINCIKAIKEAQK